MIDGGWSYVWASYALTGAVLVVLAMTVMLRLRYWSRRARDLAQGGSEGPR